MFIGATANEGSARIKLVSVAMVYLSIHMISYAFRSLISDEILIYEKLFIIYTILYMNRSNFYRHILFAEADPGG